MDGKHRLHRIARAQRGEESQGALTLCGFLRVPGARARRQAVDEALCMAARVPRSSGRAGI
jgi:hypothetical protein